MISCISDIADKNLWMCRSQVDKSAVLKNSPLKIKYMSAVGAYVTTSSCTCLNLYGAAKD